jgi:hypothetical protein
MSKKLTKRKFVNWLKKQHPNKRIKTGCSDNCPIALCLLDKGAKFDKDNGVLSDWPTGIWSTLFVNAIDDVGVLNSTRCVSPKQCLDVLKEID